MDKDRIQNPDASGSGAQWAPIPDERWAMQNAAYYPERAQYEGADDSCGVLWEDAASECAARTEYLGAEEAGSTAVGPRGQYAYESAGTPASVDRTVVRRPVASAYSEQRPSSSHSDAHAAPRADQRSAGPSDRDGFAPRPRRPRRHAKHGCLSLILWLVLFVVVAFMALRCVPASMANGKAIPELSSFVPLMFVPLIPVVVLAVLWRRRFLAACSIAALLVMGLWHHGFFIATSRVSQSAETSVALSASTDDSAARIMTLNTCNGQASAEEIVRICREQNVEVLCLQEIGGTMLDDLAVAGIYDVLPYHVVSDAASQVDNGGKNGIWTAAPMSNVSTNLVGIATSAMPAADIAVGSSVVRIVSVHPNSPVRGAQDLWSEGLESIQSLGGLNHNYLIMGDFNSTWDHARFRELLGTSFVDAGEQAGEGFHMTYPANSRIPSLIEIDHIVYSRGSGLAVSDLETVEVTGTDHKALLATLEAQ